MVQSLACTCVYYMTQTLSQQSRKIYGTYQIRITGADAHRQSWFYVS